MENVKQKHTMQMLISFALCAFVFNTKAQEVWNKIYIEDRPIMVFSSVVAYDSSYFTTGVTLDKGGHSNYGRVLMAKINEAGSLVNYQSFYDSVPKEYGMFYNTIIENQSSELVCTGYAYDSLPKVIMVKQELDGDSIAFYEYTTPNAYSYQGYKIIQYGSDYFIAGVRTLITTNSPDNFLMKIDSSGNRVWEKYYGTSNNWEYAMSLIELNNGNLMLGSFRSDDNSTHNHANTWLIETDTAGIVQRQWFDPNDSTFVAEGLLQTQDGGFIYGAQKKFLQTINSIYYTATVVKMDNNFNKQWTFKDGSYNDLTGIYDLIELPDGNFIGCGNKPFYNGDSSMVSGWVVKLSATGNVIWNRTYAGLKTVHSWNYLTDIDVMPDGSLIAVGQCQNLWEQPSQVGWFLKLDSNGCEVENCLVGIDEPRTESQDTKQIAIYPNPFTTDLSIALKAPFGGLGGATFTITNAIGQTLYRREETNLATGYTKMLDLSYLPNGVYFVEVTTTSPNLSQGEGFHAVTKVVKQ